MQDIKKQNIKIEIKNMNLYYGDFHALKGINMEIPTNQVTAFIGPSGCGKSTCVNLISGVYIQDSGKIVFDNEHELYRQKIQERARMGVGRTFQSPKPFTNLTVRDSVLTIALLYNKTWKKAEEKTDEMLEFLDLASYAQILSGKLPIEKRKWLDMARVMVTDPKLLMLDEPSMGLAPILVGQIFAIIWELHQSGTTILLVEQNAEMALQVADRAYVLESGKIALSGTGRELAESDSIKKAYLGG